MSKFLNISTDNTLGGNSPSDVLVASQKAIKEYVDSQSGGGGGSGYHPDLFTWQWEDHELNDVQWLRADTFSWQRGAVYQVAYQHLVDDIDGKTLQSETVGGTTIQFYLADDGHKICPASEESNVTAIYTATGVAWYYTLDTVNQRFKLPRSKHNKYTSSLSVIGNGYGLSLTNGSVTFGIQNDVDYSYSAWGKSTQNVGAPIGSSANRDMGTYSNIFGVSQDPTLSGLTTTTIAQDTDQYKYLYFYVGNFTQTALENTAGVTTETLNDKLDLDVGNATSATKEAIVRWGLPDYDNPISISTFNSSHPYTATKDGLFKAVTGTSVELYVNGAEAYYGGVSSGGQAWAMTAFVSKGDIITTDASSTVRVQLFPLKGVA